MDSVNFKNLTTFNTALCSISEVTILLTPKSLTAEIKIRLSDSVPHEVKNISDGKKADGAIKNEGEVVLVIELKGTNKKDIHDVLKRTHKIGIKNVVYTVFGFPTETKEEFLETIQFLTDNKKYIDLCSEEEGIIVERVNNKETGYFLIYDWNKNVGQTVTGLWTSMDGRKQYAVKLKVVGKGEY